MRSVIASIACALVWCLSSTSAVAQPAPTESPWSVDVGIGWDNSVTGNALDSGIGTFAGQAVVIDELGWDDLYGTAVNFRVGVGYALDERAELRGNFRYQSTEADAVRIGNLGGSDLFAELDDYQAWSLDGGYRRYFRVAADRWRPYAEGTLGFAQIGEIEAAVTAPSAGVLVNPVQFFDSSTAFSFGGAGGVLYSFSDRVAADARLGLRYVGGLNGGDGLAAGGLDDIDDDTGRWTLPLTVGVRIQF